MPGRKRLRTAFPALEDTPERHREPRRDRPHRARSTGPHAIRAQAAHVKVAEKTSMFKSPTANSNDAYGLDLVSMPIDATPETEYRRATNISRYRASQDQWSDPGSAVSRAYSEF